MSGIEIRCSRRISKADLLCSSVDLVAIAEDKMIADLARGAIETIRKESARFTRQRSVSPFGDGEILVEIAAALIPTDDLAYLESRARECERERQRSMDLERRVREMKARRQKMRRRGR